MIRIRLYSLVLSIPILLSIGGIGTFLYDPLLIPKFDVPIGLIILGYAVALQIFLVLIVACPRCGKSPYVIGPFKGPIALIGKPVPDRICSNCGFDLQKGHASSSQGHRENHQ